MSEVERLEEQLKIARAEQRKEDLQNTGVAEFKSAVAKADTLDDLRKIAGNFVSKINNINSILRPQEKGRRGRKPSQ